MSFALCPDEGFPRLWRFVDDGVLPANVVSTLDPAQNVQVIARNLFDRLPELERLSVLHTHRTLIYV